VFSFELIEEPRGKPRGIFDRKEFCLFFIRSLTPQQAAQIALAIAVQPECSETRMLGGQEAVKQPYSIQASKHPSLCC